MRINDSGSPIVAAALAVWLVLLAAVPVACSAWLTHTGIIALVAFEAALSIALLMAKVRARKAQQEQRQISAMRTAIQKGILY